MLDICNRNCFYIFMIVSFLLILKFRSPSKSLGHTTPTVELICPKTLWLKKTNAMQTFIFGTLTFAVPSKFCFTQKISWESRSSTLITAKDYLSSWKDSQLFLHWSSHWSLSRLEISVTMFPFQRRPNRRSSGLREGPAALLTDYWFS